jgi:LmbE family N-acetylglucosaminyl deacetylase
LLSSSSALVIAPHPDDETLGAGGTLLRLKEAGARIVWLLVTSAAGAGYDDAYVAQQKSQVDAVRNAYPFDGFHWFGLPASQLHRADRAVLVDRLRTLIAEIRPATIFVPHAHDAHDDHGAVHQAALAACKSFYMRELGVSRILAMEILSETDAAPPSAASAFLPTVTVDISGQLARKTAILKLYASELQAGPGPRTIDAVEAQARLAGASVGVAAAERFMLVRELVA